MIPPLRFFQDNFTSSCRIWTVDGALERRGASASRAFGFSKKYLKAQKLSRKHFCNLFFITRCSKIYLNIVLWLLTASIHADPVLSLRVGKNQEQLDSSETLWSDSDDEVVQWSRGYAFPAGQSATNLWHHDWWCYWPQVNHWVWPHTARATIALPENRSPDYGH